MGNKKRPAGTVRQKKKSIKSMFIRGFLQSFFIVAILLAAGVAGYQLTIKRWTVQEQVQEVLQVPEPTKTPISEVRMDDISKNLIFCYDSDTNTIRRLVLEVFHREKKQLTYLTIPMNTQLVLSDTLYKELVLYQPAMPQMLRLSAVAGYLEAPVIFDCVVLMVEDLLELPISYYSVLPDALYGTIFEEKDILPDTTAKMLLSPQKPKQGKSGDGKSGVGTSGQTGEVQEAEVFTGEYLKLLKTLDDEAELEAYIEELYQEMSSNLPLSDKMNYLDSYFGISMEDISFTRIAGENKNSGFAVDLIGTIRQLNKLEVYSREDAREGSEEE